MGFLETGLSIRVSRRIGVSLSVVSRLQDRSMERGRSEERRRSGRPRTTTHAQDRFIMLQALRDRIATANSIKQQLRRATKMNISDQTIRNRPDEAKIASRIPQFD